MFDEIRPRITEFVIEYPGVEVHEAVLLRKEYALQYGTTPDGLMWKAGLKDPEQFLKKYNPGKTG